MPTVSGFTTVADLVDGQSGASVVFSNESHVFSASAEGTITTGSSGNNLPDFTTTVSIYLGSTVANYENSATPTANNRWTVQGSTDVSGQSYRTLNVTGDLQIRIADSNGAMTLHDRATSTSGFVDQAGASSLVITIPILVQVNGQDILYNRSLSIAKVLGGSAPFIRMAATRQTFRYEFRGTSPLATESDITFTASSFNFMGTPTGVWEYSVDGGNFLAITDGANSNFSGEATDTSTLVLTRAGFQTHLGSGRSVIYRFRRTSTGSSTPSLDQIAVIKIEDSDAAGAVLIAVAAGNAILKNNPAYSSSDSSTYVDLEAQLYVGGNRINDGFFTTGTSRGTLTFVWSKNGTAIPASGSGSLQVTQPSNYGRTAYRIRLGGADITDGGTETYSCAITYV